MRTAIGVALVLSMISFPVILSAQAAARQATPAELGQAAVQEIPSPMLLEVSLGAKENAKSLSDPSVKGRTYVREPFSKRSAEGEIDCDD